MSMSISWCTVVCRDLKLQWNHQLLNVYYYMEWKKYILYLLGGTIYWLNTNTAYRTIATQTLCHEECDIQIQVWRDALAVGWTVL